jgi:hypothetical protein
MKVPATTGATNNETTGANNKSKKQPLNNYEKTKNTK